MADGQQRRRRQRFRRPSAGDGLQPQAVARARNGDEEALLFLYALHADRVQAASEAVLGDTEEAEASTQRLFVQLSSSLRERGPGLQQFEAWLVGLARRDALARAGRSR